MCCPTSMINRQCCQSVASSAADISNNVFGIRGLQNKAFFSLCLPPFSRKMTNTAPQHDLRLNITNRQVLGMALPISFGILVPQLNFITNNIFLGQLSEQALA